MASIAKTYVGELRDHIDPQVIPIFPPNAIVPVGAIGTITDGRFVTRTTMDELGHPLELVDDSSPADMVYATKGKVAIKPQASVPGPTGEPLAAATLDFSGGDAVMVSLKAVSGKRAKVRDFDAILWQLFASKQLAKDEVAVWAASTAASGAIVVALERSASIDVKVPIAGVLGFAQLAVGAEFSNDRNTSYNTTGGPLTVSVRLRRPTPTASQPIGDVFGLEPPAGTFANVLVDDLL